MRASLAAARAYAGWLLTNPDFVEEYSALWEVLKPLVFEVGAVPVLATDVNASAYEAKGWKVTHAAREDASIAALRDFCARWRLAQLEGPLLPLPNGFLHGAILPCTDLESAEAYGYQLVVFLDTQPLLHEGLFRRNVARWVSVTAAEHLAEWYSVIDARKTAKASLEKYASVFEVQYYVRVLMSRHADVLVEQMPALKRALSVVLGTTPRTIDRLLKFVDERLGPAWWSRPAIDGQ